MPLSWRFDHAERVVLVRGSGTVGYDDLVPLLQAIGKAGAGGYGKLIDLSAAEVGRHPERLLMAAARLRTTHEARRAVGPLALVVARDVPSEILRALAAPDRLMRAFPTSAQARRWLGNPLGRVRARASDASGDSPGKDAGG